jgi:hypothetical protein
MPTQFGVGFSEGADSWRAGVEGAAAALTSRLQSFQTEMLLEERFFAGLTRIHREPIA